MSAYSYDTSESVRLNNCEIPVVRLESQALSVVVAPASGGEVASLRVTHRGRRVETLHRALDFNEYPGEWRGKAPFQWPAVGRNSVPEELNADSTPEDLMMGSWRCEEVRYPMPILGFLRFMEFEPGDMGADDERAWVECRVRDNDYSRQFYPFEFQITIRHEIDNSGLRSTFEVVNGESSRAMPFSIGNHITFHPPFTGEGRFEDCVLASPTTEEMELNAQDMLSGNTLPRDLRSGARLEDPALWNMALGGYSRDKARVELRDPASFGFRISQRELKAAGRPTPDEFIHFVLYAEREYSSFCPEPWIGRPNSLNTGEGLVSLPPGENYIWQMSVEPA